MRSGQQSEQGTGLDRPLSLMLRIVFGLILFPVVTLLAVAGTTEVLVAVGWSASHEAGAVAFGIISGVIVGLATSTLAVWKSGNVFRNLLPSLRSRVPEPIASCIEFSVVGALLFGGGMLAGILLLGHTRREGWGIDRIPASMGLGSFSSAAAYRLDSLEGGEEAFDERSSLGLCLTGPFPAPRLSVWKCI